MKILIFIVFLLIIAALTKYVSFWFGTVFILALILGYLLTFIYNLVFTKNRSGTIDLYYVADRNDLMNLGKLRRARWWRNYSGFIFFPGIYTLINNPIEYTKRQLDNFGLNTKKDLYLYKITVPKNKVTVPFVAFVFEQGTRKINIKGKYLNLCCSEINAEYIGEIPYNQ